MTPSTDSPYGLIALVLFIVKSLWDIYREKNKPKIDFATARGVEQQAELSAAQADKIKSDIQRDVLAQVHSENKSLRELVAVLEADLKDERIARQAVEKALEQEQEKGRKREAAMASLQSEFDRDTALRANIDKMLQVANQRIEALENERAELHQRIAALEDELDKRDARIKELEASQKSIGPGGLMRR